MASSHPAQAPNQYMATLGLLAIGVTLLF